MEIRVATVETVEFTKDGKKFTFYKLWFALPNGLAFITSNKPYKTGDVVKLGLKPMITQDVRTNYRLTVVIVD